MTAKRDILMPRTPLNRPWLPSDDALLTQLCERGMSYTAMTGKLRRTLGSVKARIAKLGLRTGRGLRRRFRTGDHLAANGEGQSRS